MQDKSKRGWVTYLSVILLSLAMEEDTDIKNIMLQSISLSHVETTIDHARFMRQDQNAAVLQRRQVTPQGTRQAQWR